MECGVSERKIRARDRELSKYKLIGYHSPYIGLMFSTNLAIFSLRTHEGSRLGQDLSQTLEI